MILQARWRMTAVVMPICGLAGGQLGLPGPGNSAIVFLALFILTGILEATSGLLTSGWFLSGYFRRTLKYSESAR